MSKKMPTLDTRDFYSELIQNAPVENLHFKKWDKVNGFPFTPPAGEGRYLTTSRQMLI